MAVALRVRRPNLGLFPLAVPDPAERNRELLRQPIGQGWELTGLLLVRRAERLGRCSSPRGPTMPRKTPSKPPSVTHLCWAWRAHQKVIGQRLEAQGDQPGADACRRHQRARGSGRCRYHGGTAKRGKAHHSYKHGFYSTAHQGILARAADAYEAVQVLTSTHDELAIDKALILHKLEEINAAGPSDQAWLELRQITKEINDARDRKDRSGRPGSLLTPAPHRSGHAGSSASGSSADGFATLRWRSERPSSAEEDIAREGGGTASTTLTSAATDG